MIQKVPVKEYPNKVRDDVLVSVSVATYNHENYIKECLDSILCQKVDFSYEILLGEDESSDGTRKICMEYADRHPDKIRLFLHDRRNTHYVNGSPVGRFNFVYGIRQSRGKYIARLDGDDYWTDSSKLQRQINILEGDEEIVACHHWHRYLYENNLEDKGTPLHGYCSKTITDVKDVFANLVRLKTRTLVFRNILNESIFPPAGFDRLFAGDVPLSMILGKYGKFHFIDEVAAVYRITGTGRSRTGTKRSIENRINMCRQWLEVWQWGNAYYEGKYAQEALVTIKDFARDIIKLSGSDSKELIAEILKVMQTKKYENPAVYGAGKHSAEYWQCFTDGLSFKALIDDSEIESFNGLPVIKADQLKQHYIDAVLISSDAYEKQMHEKLIASGFPQEHIYTIYS